MIHYLIFFTYPKQINNPKPLIFTIAQNKLNNFIPSKYNSPYIDNIDNKNLEQYGVKYSSHYQERREHLLECAKKQLKNEHYDILELSVLCDFSSQRVASELNLKSDNIRQILSCFIKKLREKCHQVWLGLND